VTSLPALAAAALGATPGSPDEKRRGYDLAPPPLGKLTEAGSGDRLEDLINQLIKPKPPKSHRRLTWKCVSPSLT
jgi:hypothetical protein